jgi:hypothetical protein
MNDAPDNSSAGDSTSPIVQDASVHWTKRDVGLPPGLKEQAPAR